MNNENSQIWFDYINPETALGYKKIRKNFWFIQSMEESHLSTFIKNPTFKETRKQLFQENLVNAV